MAPCAGATAAKATANPRRAGPASPGGASQKSPIGKVSVPSTPTTQVRGSKERQAVPKVQAGFRSPTTVRKKETPPASPWGQISVPGATSPLTTPSGRRRAAKANEAPPPSTTEVSQSGRQSKQGQGLQSRRVSSSKGIEAQSKGSLISSAKPASEVSECYTGTTSFANFETERQPERGSVSGSALRSSSEPRLPKSLEYLGIPRRGCSRGPTPKTPGTPGTPGAACTARQRSCGPSSPMVADWAHAQGQRAALYTREADAARCHQDSSLVNEVVFGTRRTRPGSVDPGLDRVRPGSPCPALAAGLPSFRTPREGRKCERRRSFETQSESELDVSIARPPRKLVPGFSCDDRSSVGDVVFGGVSSGSRFVPMDDEQAMQRVWGGCAGRPSISEDGRRMRYSRHRDSGGYAGLSSQGSTPSSSEPGSPSSQASSFFNLEQSSRQRSAIRVLHGTPDDHYRIQEASPHWRRNCSSDAEDDRRKDYRVLYEGAAGRSSWQGSQGSRAGSRGDMSERGKDSQRSASVDSAGLNTSRDDSGRRRTMRKQFAAKPTTQASSDGFAHGTAPELVRAFRPLCWQPQLPRGKAAELGEKQQRTGHPCAHARAAAISQATVEAGRGRRSTVGQDGLHDAVDGRKPISTCQGESGDFRFPSRRRAERAEAKERRCSESESTASAAVRNLKCFLKPIPNADLVPESARLRKKKRSRELDEATKALVSESIKNSRFCRHLEEDVLKALCSRLEYFSFDPGDIIVRQGEEGDNLFITEAGCLEVTVNGRVANTMRRGCAFGCIALLYNVPRTATVRAKEAAGVWALGGSFFRHLVREHAERHQAKNLRLLERVHILAGLSNKQKLKVGAAALLNETFTAGSVVAEAGEECKRLYLVKSGSLNLVQGGERVSGKLEGGDIIKQVEQGGCVGEEYLRMGATPILQANLVAATDCTVVCVLIEKLASLLGSNVALQLERAFVSLSLQKAPWFESLPRLLQLSMLHNQVKTESCQAGYAVKGLERVGSMPYLALVLDGSFDAGPEKLTRGSWCQSASFDHLQTFTGVAREEDLPPASVRPDELVAGPSGGRLALVSMVDLACCLSGDAELPQRPEQVTELVCKIVMMMRVPLLKRLADFQLAAVANMLESFSGKAGEVVFEQGEDADKFYIIVQGGVRVDVDGALLRELGRGACFGERALLFHEPRSAKVTITEPNTKLWVAGRDVFEKFVTKNMLDDLRDRAKLQDWTLSLKNLRHLRMIGVGSFGSVRMVEHVKTGARYALKRIKLENGEVPEAVQEECNILAAVSHPFVLQLVKSFQRQKGTYILTELITGGQLYEQMRDKMGACSRRHAQFYIGSLVLALEALHMAGVAYRDLKPENVMLDFHGYLKLVDFGLSKCLEDGSRTFTIVGTVYYMAPEIFEGKGYSLEADYWSLGVLLYEMVVGKLPFGHECSEEDDIITALMEEELNFGPKYNDNAGKNLIERFLCRDPAERIGSNDGWAEVKEHKFFKVMGSKGDLFSQILGRELNPPLLPEGEEYSKEEYLSEKVTLSDAEELADEKLLEIQDQAKAAWQKLDPEGKGVIPSEELAVVLATATIDLSKRQIDALVEAVDIKADGVTFASFCSFLEHSELDVKAVLHALEA
ncbi:unnamed protein product [Effrenium voratum]|uniref:cGMP-dependent protein kinase n=2 Tax=Effrenium voratum TaxID=2562239 RepID=A0AA36ND98_9DINO|nr:unnamed protein product [Effrenium voratum]